MTPMAQNDRQKEPEIVISNKLYDFLKAVVTVVSPSATAIYITIQTVLDNQVSIEAIFLGMLITAILGVFILFTSRSYHLSDIRYDGKMVIREGEEGELLYTLEINDDPELLKLKSRIMFKVVNESKYETDPED